MDKLSDDGEEEERNVCKDNLASTFDYIAGYPWYYVALRPLLRFLLYKRQKLISFRCGVPLQLVSTTEISIPMVIIIVLPQTVRR
ncbi:MAG: hypothetical protein IIV97_04305, partial [Oscillospiraceae bacterium]|nr:hypothetical protein [Oscillospiraceae bacterium]